MEDTEPLSIIHPKVTELASKWAKKIRCDADCAVLLRRALSSKREQQPKGQQAPNRANTSSPGGYSPSPLGQPGAAPASPSLSATMIVNEQAHRDNLAQKKVPLFFREDYAGLVVKGNFMTLAARPHLVEEGEWLAHQRKYPNLAAKGLASPSSLATNPPRLKQEGRLTHVHSR